MQLSFAMPSRSDAENRPVALSEIRPSDSTIRSSWSNEEHYGVQLGRLQFFESTNGYLVGPISTGGSQGVSEKIVGAGSVQCSFELGGHFIFYA